MRWWRPIWIVVSLAFFACQMPAQGARPNPSVSPSPHATELPIGPAVYFSQSGRLKAYAWVDGSTYDVPPPPSSPATPSGSASTQQLKGMQTADDGVHFCLAGNTNQTSDELKPAFLYVWKVGEQPTPIASLGQIGAQTGPVLLACSFTTDLAVVGELSIQSFTELWVIRPSTGALLYHRAYPRSPSLQFSAAFDGRLLAEGTVEPASTVIRSLPDGNTVGRLSGRAIDFDLANTLAVVITGAGGTQVVSWRTPSALWTSDSVLHDFVPNPKGDGGALFLWHGKPGPVDSFDLWVFRNGQANLVASQVTEGQSTPAQTARYSDRCSASQIALKWGGRISEATGQHTLALTLTNTSSSGCYLFGYPDVALIDASGNILPLQYQRGGDQVVTAAPPLHVDLAPGAIAYVTVNKYRCDTSDLMQGAVVRLTLPADSPSLAASIAGNVSMDYCGAGDPGSIAYVSPFEPSQAATMST